MTQLICVCSALDRSLAINMIGTYNVLYLLQQSSRYPYTPSARSCPRNGKCHYRRLVCDDMLGGRTASYRWAVCRLHAVSHLALRVLQWCVCACVCGVCVSFRKHCVHIQESTALVYVAVECSVRDLARSWAPHQLMVWRCHGRMVFLQALSNWNVIMWLVLELS